MSAYPESQGGPLGSYRRSRNPEAPRTGITESLGAPGLEVAPPISEAAQSADSILQAFSSLGGLSAQIVGQRHADEAEARHLQQIAKEHSREVAVADQGHANINAAADKPDLVNKIELGEIRPEDGESVADFAKRLALQGTDGMSDEYKLQRQKALTDDIASAAQRRIDRNRTNAEAANAGLAVQSIDEATKPEQFDSAVSAVMKFKKDIPREIAEAEVGDRWLKSAVAVSRNDPKRGGEILAAARAKLGDKMKTEQETAQNLYEAAVKTRQNEQFSSLKEDVGAMLDHGAPYPTVLSFIAEEGSKLGIDVHALRREVDTEHQVLHNRRQAEATDRKQEAAAAKDAAEKAAANTVSGSILQGNFNTAELAARESKNVSNRFVLGLVDMVDAHRDEAAREAAAKLKAEHKVSFENQAISGAAALVEAGHGNLIDDVDDGLGNHMTRTELRDLAMGQKFAQIAKANPNDRVAAENGIIKAAADNAYSPSGWKNLIEGAATKTSTAAIATSKDGSLPADVTNPEGTGGYDLFKKLAAKAPGLLDTMGLSSRTKETFFAAMELEKTPLVGSDPQRALATAANIVDDPNTQLDVVKMGAIASALSLSSQRDLDVAREAMPLAKIFTRLGKTPDAAVAQAIDQVKKNRININGWSARLGNVPPGMKYRFADVAEDKITEYAKTMDGTGIDKGDLAFRFNDRTNIWEIVMRDTGASVPNGGPTTMFSTRSLLLEAVKKKEDEAIRKYRERQNSNLYTPGFPNSMSGF